MKTVNVGPIPNHIAFILDGNRRYANNWNLKEGSGHRVGFLAFMSMLKYCYELGVKYVTIFAFSIDNFNRREHEVQYVMDLMQEKIEGMLKEVSFMNSYGIRVHFLGDLKLLHEPIKVAAEKAMAATFNNTKAVLLICMAYTSTHEMVHAVQESYKEKQDEIQNLNSRETGKDPIFNGVVRGNEKNYLEEYSIKLVDLEKHMYMAIGPDPNILVHTSSETRLSNFLLWQTTYCHLYSPAALWPEISVWHLMWGALNFQRVHFYLEKKKRHW